MVDFPPFPIVLCFIQHPLLQNGFQQCYVSKNFGCSVRCFKKFSATGLCQVRYLLGPCFFIIEMYQFYRQQLEIILREQKLLPVEHEQLPGSATLPSPFLHCIRQSRENNVGNSRSYFQAPKRRRGTSTRSQGKWKIVTKGVVGLPTEETDIVSIPRGVQRAHLAELGLIGKVRLNTTWDKGTVTREISSIFRKAYVSMETDRGKFTLGNGGHTRFMSFPR